MEKVLLDTDALIEIWKDREFFEKITENYVPFLSFISLYEFLFGEVYIGKDLEKVKRGIEKVFFILFPNQPLIEKALQIDVTLSKRGEKLEFRDLIIAATAILEDLTLVTRNVKHFSRLERFGLKLRTLNSI